jgi:serine/threonine protein kinase
MVLPPPPHFDNILLTIVTTKLSAIHQSTNVPKLSVSVTDSFPKHHGEFTDIYHGDLLAETPNTTISVNNIAIKRIRIFPGNDEVKKKVISTLSSAEDLWFSLRHPNVCPTWLLKSSNEPIPAIAMPWFDNGNILDFIRDNPGVDKLAIVIQIASAVSYIHAMDQVHGNIVPANVLMNEEGRPCLCDVALNSRLSRVINGDVWPIPSGWMFKAPEELSFECEPASFMHTQAMDVYSLGITIYTIITSKFPFPARPEGRGVKEIMSRGHILNKSTEIGDPLWKILFRCWSFDPGNRASMTTVTAELEMM